MFPEYSHVLLARRELNSSPMADFKIVSNYLKTQFANNKISRELYIYLLQAFSFYALEKIIQEKLDDMMIIWHKKFLDYFKLDI